MWAERRTDVINEDSGEPDVEAVSLWVHLDVASWRPVRLTEAEIETYGPAAVERRVSARLRHPNPSDEGDGPETVEWHFRRTECDIADHVNNSAYWEPIEEELLAGSAPDPERIDAEIEYRTPAQAGDHRLRSDGDWRWILSPDGELHASMVVRRG
jgi:acyl-ACP thioesterase